MKIKILFVFILVWFLACNRKAKEYNLPESLDQSTKSSFVDYLEHGKNLYKEFCTQCHGIHSAGRDSVPNFTNAQLDMYAAKFRIQTTAVHGFVDRLSYDELENILNYLRFRKK